MPSSTQLLAFAAAAISTASAGSIQGMNVGSTDSSGAARDQANFQTYFSTSKNLEGTNNAFNSARLYTMIQGGTTNTPISAIPAAIAEDVTLLLGLWTSGTTFDDELAALKSAITTYGDKLGPLVTGISVGSEDLYRNSPTGIAAGSDIGQQPDVIVDYISQVRAAIAGTALSAAPIGHVDTWTAWVNGSNAEVINACDWLGFDGYPYWQTTDSNDVSNGKALFVESYEKVVAVSGGKDVWVTETGWAVTDTKGGEGDAKADAADAKTYWDDVGCDYLFGNINTYWYMLNDFSSSPSFGVSNSDSNTTPLYNLTCSAVSNSNSSSVSSSSSSSTTVKSIASSSASAAISSVSASAASKIASLSSVAATATGSAKSSLAAQQTSIAAEASQAASSIESQVTAAATAASNTVSSAASKASGTASSSSTSSSTATSSAGMNIVSIASLAVAAVAGLWVL